MVSQYRRTDGGIEFLVRNFDIAQWIIFVDYLDALDIGFALLPDFRGQGYAFEAAAASVEYAKNKLGAERVLGFTLVGNDPSAKLLKKLGMTYERNFKIPNDDADLELYGADI